MTNYHLHFYYTDDQIALYGLAFKNIVDYYNGYMIDLEGGVELFFRASYLASENIKKELYTIENPERFTKKISD